MKPKAGKQRRPSSTARRDQRRVLEQQVALLGVLHERAHGRAVGRAGRVVARREQQDEERRDLELVEPVAVHLGADERGEEVVARVVRALPRAPR